MAQNVNLEKSFRRLSESIKSRQIGRHPVRIKARPLDLDFLPENLSANQDSVLDYLEGKKVLRPVEIEHATKSAGLLFVVVDFDNAVVYYVYKG